jgi:hypothetical protein
MVRGLILGGIAFAAAFAAERQFEAFRKDIQRYDGLRSMSGEGPLFKQLIAQGMQSLSEFGAARQSDAKDLLTSLTGDIVRYAQLRGM